MHKTVTSGLPTVMDSWTFLVKFSVQWSPTAPRMIVMLRILIPDIKDPNAGKRIIFNSRGKAMKISRSRLHLLGH